MGNAVFTGTIGDCGAEDGKAAEIKNATYISR
jgi:hypothetical protein